MRYAKYDSDAIHGSFYFIWYDTWIYKDIAYRSLLLRSIMNIFFFAQDCKPFDILDIFENFFFESWSQLKATVHCMPSQL